MGITNFSIEILDRVFDNASIKSVCELGSQQTYVMGDRYGQFSDWYYKYKGVERLEQIDLNGDNNSVKIDLSKELIDITSVYDLVTDFGTSEHVSGKDGKHSISAIYNCWKTKYDLCSNNGFIVSENPKTRNWIGHGCNYYTEGFYKKLALSVNAKIINLGEHPAMGNTTDGWNIYCVLKKSDTPFCDLKTFKTLGIKKS